MRLALAMLVAFAGCIATLPSDPSLTADLACEAARAVLASKGTPEDDTTPKPGDTCPNCDGRGYIGDGVVKVECQPCGGTGKVKATATTTTSSCPDGRCRL